MAHDKSQTAMKMGKTLITRCGPELCWLEGSRMHSFKTDRVRVVFAGIATDEWVVSREHPPAQVHHKITDGQVGCFHCDLKIHNMEFQHDKGRLAGVLFGAEFATIEHGSSLGRFRLHMGHLIGPRLLPSAHRRVVFVSDSPNSQTAPRKRPSEIVA